MIRILLIFTSSITLFGCVTTYNYDGKTYKTQEEVVQAQNNKIEYLIADIQELPNPVSENKLIVITPSLNAIMNAQKEMDRLSGKNRNDTEKADAEIKAKTATGHYKFTTRMIKKRNIYKMVEHRPSTTYTVHPPEPTTNEDIFYITCNYSSKGESPSCQSYYLTIKYGKQVFASDRSSPDYRERNRAFLQAIESLAIRE